MALNVQVKNEKFEHADAFFQTNKYSDVFNSKNRSLCSKLIFVGMNLTTLDEDERIKEARDKITVKY